MTSLHRVCVILTSLALTAVLVWPAPARGEPFTPGCTIPFAAIAKTHPLDGSCSIEGQGSAKSQLQNRAKNNFCAAGVPTILTYQNFKSLQTAANNAKNAGTTSFGCPTCLPADRSPLRDIFTLPNGTKVGEGSLVRYVGFIAHPRYSNTSGGEAVNCKKGTQGNNDIHVDMLRKPEGQEPTCRSVTIEISPHFRPPQWERDRLREVKAHPVRVTGHLFFDASHMRCASDTDNVSPKRISLWEIHPVYAIDVCINSTLASCPAANDSKWIALHQWVNTDEDEDE
jgi:hypothetical protein